MTGVTLADGLQVRWSGFFLSGWPKGLEMLVDGEWVPCPNINRHQQVLRAVCANG